MVEDSEMAGADENGGKADADELSDDGSEDLEGESSGSEDEDLEDEEGEGDVDEAMEVDEKPTNGGSAVHQQDEVMAH
jgi:histone chaperone ASF1